MARTIACVNCGVVLNLPDNAQGRRLKCPKCHTKFQVEGEGAKPLTKSGSGAAPSPEGTILLDRKLSSANLPAMPDPGSGEPSSGSNVAPRKSSGELPTMPTASGDLRETFDLPLMMDAADSGMAVGAGARSSGAKHAADAVGLFLNAPARRRPTGAEARAAERRCPTCHGIVPVGMSLCQTCGLDLDTGKHAGYDDLLPSAPALVKTTPVAITVVGGATLAVAAALLVLTLVKWLGGAELALYLLPIPAFGVFAAVKFLQGKSVKLLLAALTMGAVVNVVALIAMPIYDANTVLEVEQNAVVNDQVDEPVDSVKPIVERLDIDRLKLGIALLAVYGGLSIYLLSPQVNRHFRK
jgi:hypothetical protein